MWINTVKVQKQLVHFLYLHNQHLNENKDWLIFQILELNRRSIYTS